MKVLLCALTGFGNQVLSALLNESQKVVLILTRKEKGPFPYYEEENLTNLARRQGIEVWEDFNWKQVEEKVRKVKPDLLLVATFHKIIPQKILALVKNCINLHPSLLPKYQGRNPMAWVLFNKEKETGVTAHELTDKLDGGNILIQKKIPIGVDEKINTLIKKLNVLSAEVVRDFLKKIKNKTLRPIPQDKTKATFFPRFKEAIAVLGGVLRKNKDGRWRTSNFRESGETHGVLGDRLRVVAGALLYKENPNNMIIAMGGRGRFKDIPDVPFLAEVIKNELVALGVPESVVMLESNSGTTYQQLQELKNIMAKESFQRIAVISNDYHLPRVEITIKQDPNLHRLLEQSRIELCSAEKILLERQPQLWKKVIEDAYSSEEMKKIIEREKKGVRMLLEGHYSCNG